MIGYDLGILSLQKSLRQLDATRGELVVIDGNLAARRLPDGRVVALIPLALGQGRITLAGQHNPYGYDQGWCYEHLHQAIAAYQAWDPTQQVEPVGWVRAIPPVAGGFRRRPPGGGPAEEYLAE